MRLSIWSLAVLTLGGCSQGEVKPPSSPTQAPSPAPSVTTYRVRITGVYVGCQPSQDAARQALTKLPGVSEVTFDPKNKAIQLRATADELKRSFAPVDAAVGTIGPRRVLADVGLAVLDIDILDKPDGLTTFKVVGQAIDSIDEPAPKDSLTLYRVFAGSPESQQAIRQALAPRKVVFEGDGLLKSIKIEGKDLDQRELQAQLKRAGFHASAPP